MKEREADRRRGCGGRDGGGQDVSGDGRDRKGEGGGGRRERKLRQDSRLPGYPHLFIDLGMIECE